MLVARPRGREAETLTHCANGHFQAVDAGPMISHSVLEPCELEGIVSSPVRDVMVKLRVLAVLVLVKLPEHTELFQGGVEGGAIDSGRVVANIILEAHRLHPHLVDILEQHPEELRDQTPTGHLGGR